MLRKAEIHNHGIRNYNDMDFQCDSKRTFKRCSCRPYHHRWIGYDNSDKDRYVTYVPGMARVLTGLDTAAVSENRLRGLACNYD